MGLPAPFQPGQRISHAQFGEGDRSAGRPRHHDILPERIPTGRDAEGAEGAGLVRERTHLSRARVAQAINLLRVLDGHAGDTEGIVSGRNNRLTHDLMD